MKLYYSQSLKRALKVEATDGYYTMTLADGTVYDNTGAVIKSLGREEFERRIVNYDGTLEEYEQLMLRKRTERYEEYTRAAQEKQVRVEYYDQLLRSGEVVPMTNENIHALVDYLTRLNSGSWDKVNMAVPYKASQYQTEGGQVYVNVEFANGLKVSNAPVRYIPKDYQPVRALSWQ